MHSTAAEKYLERITYEIRTSMNSMLGLADLLWETRLDSAQREYVNMLRSSADRLLTMNTGIAELAAPRRNAEPAEDFDVQEVLEQTAELMSMLAAEKGIVLTRAVHPGVPSRVCGHRSTVEQVLVALIRNAIRFTHRGHVVVAVEQMPTESPDVTLRFSVQDTGIGISRDQLRTLFDLSEGANDSHGLGLLVSKRAVESMNGTIEVESKVDQGSTFYVTVPFQPARSPHALDTSSVHYDRRVYPGLRLLIAEDSADNMFLLHAFLRDQDVHVERAENGQVALDKIKFSHYDLVLMDIEMPILDGHETTRQLRAWEEMSGTRSVPVVALTAHTSPDQIDRCASAGCSAYLSKPINKRRLVEAINRYALKPRWPEDIPDYYLNRR